MYLVDKEHIVFLKRSEQSGKVAGLVENRTRCHFEAHAQFVGNDVAQSGLAESRRSVKQHMVKCFATLPCSRDKDAEVLYNLVLSGKIGQALGAQGLLKVLVIARALVAYIEILFHRLQR